LPPLDNWSIPNLPDLPDRLPEPEPEPEPVASMLTSSASLDAVSSSKSSSSSYSMVSSVASSMISNPSAMIPVAPSSLPTTPSSRINSFLSLRRLPIWDAAAAPLTYCSVPGTTSLLPPDLPLLPLLLLELQNASTSMSTSTSISEAISRPSDALAAEVLLVLLFFWVRPTESPMTRATTARPTTPSLIYFFST